MAEQEMAVEMRNISKYFNGICALHDVNLQIKRGLSMPCLARMGRENPP